MSKNNKKRSGGENNIVFWLCLACGSVFLGLFAMLDMFSKNYPAWIGLVLFAAYTTFAVIAFVIHRKHLKGEESFREKTLLMEKAMTGMMKDVDIPCILTLRSGLIAWSSNGALEMLGTSESLLQKNITELCPLNLARLISLSEGEKLITEGENAETDPRFICINDKYYNATLYKHVLGKNIYYLITFEDCTDYTNLKAKYVAEYPVVAHIMLDNLNEIAEYVRVNYRSAANEIEEILKKFAEEMNGFIMEYNRDKYIMLFSNEKYLECVEKKFDILERVRNVRLGDSSVPVTISMGISLVGENFEEREKNAASALEFALQRGGDQVAVKAEDDILFFGGRTKGFQKKFSTSARVLATRLTSIVASAGNILIMGHANPDFDAIGACIGAARLCMHCGINPKIVMDTNNPNFKACTDKLLQLEEYKNIFISAEAGLDMIRSDTLLIIVDANNFNILESPDVARNISNFVVIDHHRKVAPFDTEPQLALIEPSSSSASEMITEILEQCLTEDTLHKEEANLLLAGIMVDTKNFTRTTGTKTFGAAMYLRIAGANSEIARTYFREDFDSFLSEAKFSTNVMTYMGRIAIAESNGTNANFDRVSAAKAADKLLEVKGVDASFALVIIENRIHISARSNGKINVQLILEKLGGGGHFDSAAAAVTSTDMKATLHLLKAAIDEYFKENPDF